MAGAGDLPRHEEHTVLVLSAVLPLVACSASIVALIYQQVRLTRLPRDRQRKMFVRQLVHLAAANLVYAAFASMELVMEVVVVFDGPPVSTSAGQAFCVATSFGGALGNEVSMLFEIHLALAFLASIWHSVAMFQVLARSLLWIWPCGLLVAVLDICIIPRRWAAPFGKACKAINRESVWEASVSVCVVACLVCYILSSVSICTSGGAVQARVWSRAKRYSLVVIVTMAPTMYYNVSSSLRDNEHQYNVIFLIATTLYNTTGLLNFSLYVLHQRYSRQKHSSCHPEGERSAVYRESFRVNFRNVESVLEFVPSVQESPNLSYPDDAEQLTLSTYLGDPIFSPPLSASSREDVALSSSVFESTIEVDFPAAQDISVGSSTAASTPSHLNSVA